MPAQLSPEAQARENIDQMLGAAGWIVQSRDEANVAAARGVAFREFPLKFAPGNGIPAIRIGIMENDSLVFQAAARLNEQLGRKYSEIASLLYCPV